MPEEAVQAKLCFVVSPIGAPGSPERIHADWLLKGIIEPVFDLHFIDFKVERADKIAAPGMIDSQVINRLLDAELVIADMSMLNANAFYEMGIRHMKQKPIIHMYRDGDKIPFDVAPYRAIPFSFVHPDDLTAAKNLLKRAVDEVLKPNFQVENPVTRARGVQKLEEHATDSERVLLSQLEAIQDRLQSLEDNSFRGPSKFVALSDIGLFSDDNPLTWQSHARRMKAPSFKFIEVTLTPTDDTDELAEANARAFGAVRAKFPKADFSIIRQDDHCTTIRVGSGFANPIEMYLLSLPEVDRAQTVAVQG